jgi:hypothetical protein
LLVSYLEQRAASATGHEAQIDMKSSMKRILPMFVCAVGAVILIAREFAEGLISPRGMGVALLTVGVGIGIGVVLIVRKTTAEPSISPPPQGTTTDEATRNSLMNRLHAIFAFISGGGLLILLSPYVMHEAAVRHLPWSVAIIVIPMYAVLSYAGFKLFWPRITGRAATTFQQKDPKKDN